MHLKVGLPYVRCINFQAMYVIGCFFLKGIESCKTCSELWKGWMHRPAISNGPLLSGEETPGGGQKHSFIKFYLFWVLSEHSQRYGPSSCLQFYILEPVVSKWLEAHCCKTILGRKANVILVQIFKWLQLAQTLHKILLSPPSISNPILSIAWPCIMLY